MDASELDRLFAIEEIRQLKARYCRFVDTKQWQRLEELFMPEARLEGFGSVPDGSDPATFVAGVSVRLADAITIHHVHEPEVKLTDPGRARGIWPMMDYVDLRPTEPGENPQADRGWIGWGYYEEEYERRDDVWRISFMRLARQRMDALTADHPLAKFDRHGPDSGWL